MVYLHRTTGLHEMYDVHKLRTDQSSVRDKTKISDQGCSRTANIPFKVEPEVTACNLKLDMLGRADLQTGIEE